MQKDIATHSIIHHCHAEIAVEFRHTMLRLMPMTHTRHLEYARTGAGAEIRR